ncbi:hypothetical protein EV667_3012 [Ancylobacter aquaticus]|uniref:Exopolysaccharide production protein YjbE n=1 Tax=Ancylobacter aquaticus TaxID=100 RepID=A0A4R1I1E5_ANCAQ|nr:hypothetical protein [Ancylobacter aquaticus]TCK28994.1 hypothetical protein EV667_3012 [Ancylobacter aquaticus]
MKMIALCATLSLMAGAAYAGPCTERIAQIEKDLSATDAGSGPTQSAPAATTASDPGVPRAGEAPGTGGTAGMNATVGNKATSPADVRAQTSGQPTAAQGGASSAKQVSDAVARAKQADKAGDDNACQKALDEAEKLMRG